MCRNYRAPLFISVGCERARPATPSAKAGQVSARADYSLGRAERSRPDRRPARRQIQAGNQSLKSSAYKINTPFIIGAAACERNTRLNYLQMLHFTFVEINCYFIRPAADRSAAAAAQRARSGKLLYYRQVVCGRARLLSTTMLAAGKQMQLRQKVPRLLHAAIQGHLHLGRASLLSAGS